ncbi:hypothetical protein F5Y04DRAFT_263057 [Hypomontagnella monticulosa]|nr:hypothetical protein F5Y04DRAFT_263057 [Hypomontagnella monticulosa]
MNSGWYYHLLTRTFDTAPTPTSMLIFNMIFSFVPLITAVAGFFNRQSEPVDAWTLFNSSIKCDAASCNYNFFVHKEVPGEVVHCHFDTSKHANPSALLIDRVCHKDPLWTVSLSWSPDYSAVLCIADEAQNLNAFYGFEYWEIYHGRIVHNKTEWAWEVGQLPSPREEIIEPTAIPEPLYYESP